MTIQALKERWENREKHIGEDLALAKKELGEIGKKIGQLMDRILASDSPGVIKAYEEHIKSLEARKAELGQMAKKGGRSDKGFDQTYRTALAFFRNPQKLWVSEHIEDKRIVLKLVFAKPLEYGLNDGYRTVLTSCPFRLFSGFLGGKEVLVEESGESSNFSAFEELNRWGAIIEKTRSFSSHYGISSK